MPRYAFRIQRLYLRVPLIERSTIELDKGQTNYLINVMRMSEGGELLLFNGRDGEWLGRIEEASRKHCVVTLVEQTRPQTPHPDLHYLFAPLKHARLDYMVQKAVEMGAGSLRPIMTQHTQVNRVNVERMQSNVIEAAEQCGILAVPEVREPAQLADLVETWSGREGRRRILFCDEGTEEENPIPILAGLPRDEPLAVLIGPEGGFSKDERLVLRAQTFVTAIPLGPRILRADTAAVAALALVQAALGDW